MRRPVWIWLLVVGLVVGLVVLPTAQSMAWSQHGGGRVFIGVGPAFWWGPPYPWYGYPPYYYPPAQVIVEQPHMYIQQAQAQGNHAGQWLRRYKGLPPDQQQKALDNDPQFRSLPPMRQQILRERLQRFSSLPPRMQDRILQRMETWEHLTPAQKQQARQLYSQLKDLPPERRQKVRTAIRDLSVMPPEQRQQIIESDRFKSEFSPQERGLLSSASQLPLAPESGPNEPAPED